MFPGRVLLLSATRKFNKNKRELNTKRFNPTHANWTYLDYLQSSPIKTDDGYSNLRQIIETGGLVNMQM